MEKSIDLNEIPPESRQFEESAPPPDLQDEHPASHNGSGTVPSAIDADAVDDEVTFLTAREWYAEVWSHIRRERSSIAIDETLETNAEHSGVAMEEQIPIICPDCRNSASLMNRMTNDFVVYTGDDVPTVKDDARQLIPEAETEASASASAANESTLICPVCMCTLNEPSSTSCGHVFCRGCIENAIKQQKKCPTCRKKLTKKSFHRIYLPST